MKIGRTTCYSLLIAVLASCQLCAAPVGVPRFNQLHEDGFTQWFEGVETNLYDETHSYRLTYDDLKNHSNIRFGLYSDSLVYDINADPDRTYGDRFAESDYQDFIDGEKLCAPTAVAMVLSYWGDNGYPNLKDTEINMIGNLAQYEGNCGLGKTQDDGFFLTFSIGFKSSVFLAVDNAGYISDLTLATYSFVYANSVFDTSSTTETGGGYTWTTQRVYGKGYGDESGVTVYKNEIDNNRPVLIAGTQALFGHAVTGIGYTDDKVIVISYGEVKRYDWNCIGSLCAVDLSPSSDTELQESPSGLTAALSDDDVVSLSWDAVPGATEYHVYRGLIGGGTYFFDKIATVTVSSYTDEESKEEGSTHYYCVTAFNSANKAVSAPSNEARITVPTSTVVSSGGGGGCFINTAW